MKNIILLFTVCLFLWAGRFGLRPVSADTTTVAQFRTVDDPFRTLYYLHGNSDEGCIGQGQIDVVNDCDTDGPMLLQDTQLDAGSAAVWGPVSPGFSGNNDRNIYDPNWVLTLDQPTELDGAITAVWWASCASCGMTSANWHISLWADGVLRQRQRVTATPDQPNVPSRLSATIVMTESVSALQNFVIQIDPVLVTQIDTRIYYDSAQGCLPTLSDPCDSHVLLPVVFNGGSFDPYIYADFVYVTEGQGSAELSFSLSEASNKIVTVDYTTVDFGDATAELDYISTSGTLTFQPGETRQTISIVIIDDDEQEFTEGFAIYLSNPSNAYLANDGYVYIHDDDAGAAGNVSIDDVTVGEGADSAELQITLDEPSESDLRVHFYTYGFDATGEEDYVETFGSVTIPTGATSADITIDLIDDMLNEQDEQFFVQVYTGDFEFGTSDNALVTILDDDTELPTISVLDTAVNEGDGYVYVTVVLSQPSGRDIDFIYDTFDGITAAFGGDYSGEASSATIPRGATSTSLYISIYEDEEDENTETFAVTITDVDGATIANSKGIVRINDNGAQKEVGG